MNIAVVQARKERHLTQKKLAGRMRLNHMCIALVELHDWIPPRDIRKRLAKELAATEAQLFGDTVAALSV